MGSTPKFTGLKMREVNQLLQTPKVRKELEARAARVAPRARALAYQAGANEFAKAIRVSTGTRPGTGARGGLQRTYARVGATVTPEMVKADRRAKLTRMQILRRATNA